MCRIIPVSQQVQHQVGGLPADAHLGLADQGQVRKNFTEKFQLVEPDHGKILRNPDVVMLQGQHSPQGHFKVRHKQGGGAALQLKQLLNRLVAAVHGIVAIADVFLLRGNARLPQHVQVAVQTLVGGIQVRNAQHDADPPVAKADQLPHRLACGVGVVNHHGADPAPEAVDDPVDQQNRNVRGQGGFQVRPGHVGGHVDEPVYPAVKQKIHRVLFTLRIAAAVTDNDRVIFLAQYILHGGDNGRYESVAEFGNYNPDDPRMLCFQAPCHLVGHIVEFFDRGLNQHPVFFPHGAAVEILG